MPGRQTGVDDLSQSHLSRKAARGGAVASSVRRRVMSNLHMFARHERGASFAYLPTLAADDIVSHRCFLVDQRRAAASLVEVVVAANSARERAMDALVDFMTWHGFTTCAGTIAKPRAFSSEATPKAPGWRIAGHVAPGLSEPGWWVPDVHSADGLRLLDLIAALPKPIDPIEPDRAVRRHFGLPDAGNGRFVVVLGSVAVPVVAIPDMAADAPIPPDVIEFTPEASVRISINTKCMRP